jgi:hypothetical protein
MKAVSCGAFETDRRYTDRAGQFLLAYTRGKSMDTSSFIGDNDAFPLLLVCALCAVSDSKCKLFAVG